MFSPLDPPGLGTMLLLSMWWIQEYPFIELSIRETVSMMLKGDDFTYTKNLRYI